MKINSLKKKAKKLYVEYFRRMDDYDCGTTLAETITPELYMMRKKFNKIMDELAKLDLTAPKMRL